LDHAAVSYDLGLLQRDDLFSAKSKFCQHPRAPGRSSGNCIFELPAHQTNIRISNVTTSGNQRWGVDCAVTFLPANVRLSGVGGSGNGSGLINTANIIDWFPSAVAAGAANSGVSLNANRSLSTRVRSRTSRAFGKNASVAANRQTVVLVDTTVAPVQVLMIASL
jgi:hypothetical protein